MKLKTNTKAPNFKLPCTDKSIFEIEPVVQDKSKEIRYSKKVEFNEETVNEYFKKNIDLNSKKFDDSLLKGPYFLNI